MATGVNKSYIVATATVTTTVVLCERGDEHKAEEVLYFLNGRTQDAVQDVIHTRHSLK
jgi:hypothetical protein